MRITKVMRAKGNYFDIKNYQILANNSRKCVEFSLENLYVDIRVLFQQYAADHFTPVLINKSTCTYSHDTVASFFFHSMHPPPHPPTRPRHKKKLIVIHSPGGEHLGIFWEGMCRPGLGIGTPF